MRIRRTFAQLFLLFACAPFCPSTAAAPAETVDAATVNRILHLNNIANCLDAHALMITDPARIDQPPAGGEKRTGPPPADAQTIEILKAHADTGRSTHIRITLLFITGATGGEAEKFASSAYTLCLARARLAWARGQAAATLSWLEQAVDRSEFAHLAGSAAFDTNSMSFDQLAKISRDWTATQLNAYAVRHSCEALGYDLADIDKQPRLHDGTGEPKAIAEHEESLSPPQRFSTVGKFSQQRSSDPVAMAPIHSGALRRFLSLCQASVCLGLFGTSPSENKPSEYLAAPTDPSSGLAALDPETQQSLNDRLQRAMQSYRYVKRFSDAGAAGGGIEHRSLAALHLCRAHAAVAWAKGDAATTLLWLDRAIRWSKTGLDATSTAFDANRINFDSLVAAQEADANANLVALAVRKSCEWLLLAPEYNGTKSDDVSTVGLDDSTIAKDRNARAASQVDSLRGKMRLSNVACCLELPPLFYGPELRVAQGQTRRGPLVADATTIEILLAHSDRAILSYRRSHALCLAGAMGGDSETTAKGATEVCFARARLAWATGEAAMSVAWLDQATHWSRTALEAGDSSRSVGATTLESYLVTNNMQTKARLATHIARLSCEKLGLDLNFGKRAPSLPDDALRPKYETYTQRVRMDFGLPNPN